MKQLEILHDQICKKILLFNELSKEVSEIYNDLIFETSPFLCENLNNAKDNCINEYIDIINKHKFLDKMVMIISNLKEKYEAEDIKNSNNSKEEDNPIELFKKKMKEYNSIEINPTNTKVENNNQNCIYCGNKVFEF